MKRLMGYIIVEFKAAFFCYDLSMSRLANDCIKHNLLIKDYQSIAQRHRICG